MIIELLKFKVSQKVQKKFIELDKKIWTSMLKNCDGFIDKEVWISAEKPEEIICVVRWKSRQQWKAISDSQLQVTEKNFAEKMGDQSYQLMATLEYNLV